MAFDDLVSELIGVFPRLSPEYAPKLINKAWSDIRDMRLWSFQFDYADLISPIAITTGLVSVTAGSTSVLVTLEAQAAFDAVALLPAPAPPLSSPVLGVGYQFRIQNTNTGGPIYNIVAWDSATFTLTLDRPYAGPTVASATYQVYKCYFAAPVDDFVRFISIDNRTSGYAIRGKRLCATESQLNAMDPQRGGTGQPYLVAMYQPNSVGQPVYEFYPAPVNFYVFNCWFQRRGTDLSESNPLPTSFPESTLMNLAFMKACSWALASVATYPELGATNWVAARRNYEQEFKENLIQAIKQDDEIMPQIPFSQMQSIDFPLGGQFLQGHDLSSLFGR